MRLLGLLTIFWLLAGPRALADAYDAALRQGAIRPPTSSPTLLAMRKLAAEETDPEKKEKLEKLVQRMERDEAMRQMSQQKNTQTARQAKRNGGAPPMQQQQQQKQQQQQQKDDAKKSGDEDKAAKPDSAAQTPPAAPPAASGSDTQGGPAPDDLSQSFFAFNKAQAKKKQADASAPDPADAVVGQVGQLATMEQIAPLAQAKAQLDATQKTVDSQAERVPSGGVRSQVVDLHRVRGVKRPSAAAP